jgi:hypothetical protein
VEVGRPTTLSADELEWDAPGSSDLDRRGGNRFRRLFAETPGYSIAAEFESVEAADNARQEFAELVRKVESLISNSS